MIKRYFALDLEGQPDKNINIDGEIKVFNCKGDRSNFINDCQKSRLILSKPELAELRLSGSVSDFMIYLDKL